MGTKVEVKLDLINLCLRLQIKKKVSFFLIIIVRCKRQKTIL